MPNKQVDCVSNEMRGAGATPQLQNSGALLQQPPLAASRPLPLPSRYSNPFATCWTRPGALPFRWPSGQSAARIIGQFKKQQWRGAVVGPHGSGKSTLLATLIPEIQNAGVTIYHITLQNGQRRLPIDFLPITPSKRTLLILDGYEQLGWFERYRINRHRCQTGCGLLVTSHAPLRIPTLIELNPDARLVLELVDELTTRAPSPILAADVLSCQKLHGPNVREIFFDLYDRHQQLERVRTFI
jgi:hypothetical protein